MKLQILSTVVGLLCTLSNPSLAQSKQISVDHFDKVIISPHIQADLVKNPERSVVIEEADVPLEKIRVKVEGRTLRVYLEDAKTITKSEKIRDRDRRYKKPVYSGTLAKVTINYTNLKKLSVRGEERVQCMSDINQDYFRLKVYGETDLVMNAVRIKELKVTIYGESRLKIKSGSVGHQIYTTYGESRVNTVGVDNRTTKILAYGESDFDISVDDQLNVNAFGEAHINYNGNASVRKGIWIGKSDIRKVGG